MRRYQTLNDNDTHSSLWEPSSDLDHFEDLALEDLDLEDLALDDDVEEEEEEEDDDEEEEEELPLCDKQQNYVLVD